MTEVKGGDDLPKEPPRLLRSKPSFLHEVVKEFSARHVFQHQVQIFAVFIHVVQTQHILVFDQLHDRNFPLHFLEHRLTELLLVDDLDGHLLPKNAVGPQLDQT